MPQPPLRHTLSLPLGVVRVSLDRRGMNLADRGGFEAQWALGLEQGEVTDVLSAEEFREVIKNHLREVYRQEVGQEPPAITLNLASHQLLDDITGWSKLNAGSR